MEHMELMPLLVMALPCCLWQLGVILVAVFNRFVRGIPFPPKFWEWN